VKDRTTAENFDVPSSTLTQGIGGAWEYRRAGYSLLLNGAWFGRAAWAPWGLREPGASTAATTTPQTYQKYQAGLSRDIYLNPFHKIHLNAAWFGGHDLDRFVKYQFGLFDDTRIHGVPASGVRYGEIAMMRGSYSINVLEQYRFDLFLDQAWGRDDPGHGPWQPLSGFGVAVNLRAPFNTIFRAELGKSLLPARYDSLGSTNASNPVPETAQMTPILRADLHVHSCHSKVSGTMPFLGSRDCYSTPAEVYRVAKARGMDLVALTDHDSIDGALELLATRPDATDVIVGEEVSCLWPGAESRGPPRRLRHDRAAASRGAVPSRQRLRRHRAPASGRGVLLAESPAAFLSRADPVRALPPAARRGAGARGSERDDARGAQYAGESMAQRRAAALPGSPLGMVAGSDAHTLRRVGTTWTAAPGRDREEFMASLRQGLGLAGGRHGTAVTVAGDAYGVIGRYLAALAGHGPRDLAPLRRAACLAFAGATLPFQFMPLAVAMAGKRREGRQVARATAHVMAVGSPAGSVAQMAARL